MPAAPRKSCCLTNSLCGLFPPSHPGCLGTVRWRVWGISCGGAHGCVHYVGAGAPGPGSRYNPPVEGPNAKKGQSHFSHSFLYTMATLICYLLWVPRTGVPKQCFATDALWEGGCPCAQTLIRYQYVNLVVLTLPGVSIIALKRSHNKLVSAEYVCHTTNFPTPLWGWGVLGTVNNTFSLHSDKLNLG
jgi:hypothetical protein